MNIHISIMTGKLEKFKAISTNVKNDENGTIRRCFKTYGNDAKF